MLKAGSHGRAAGGLLAVLLAAGCGSSTAGSAIASAPSAPVSTTASATSEPAMTTTTEPPPPPPPPTAADGANYKACRSGGCEVLIPGPVRIAVDGGTLSVTKVSSEEGVEFSLKLSGASWSGTLKGTCGGVFRFFRGGGSSFVGCGASGIPEPPTAEPGALTMQLAGFADGGAVLRMVSG